MGSCRRNKTRDLSGPWSQLFAPLPAADVEQRHISRSGFHARLLFPRFEVGAPDRHTGLNAVGAFQLGNVIHTKTCKFQPTSHSKPPLGKTEIIRRLRCYPDRSFGRERHRLIDGDVCGLVPAELTRSAPNSLGSTRRWTPTAAAAVTCNVAKTRVTSRAKCFGLFRKNSDPTPSSL